MFRLAGTTGHYGRCVVCHTGIYPLHLFCGRCWDIPLEYAAANLGPKPGIPAGGAH